MVPWDQCESTNSSSTDKTRTLKPKDLIGRRVQVYWSAPATVKGWHCGSVLSQLKNGKFSVEYDSDESLEGEDSNDKVFPENLLGTQPPKWEFLPEDEEEEEEEDEHEEQPSQATITTTSVPIQQSKTTKTRKKEKQRMRISHDNSVKICQVYADCKRKWSTLFKDTTIQNIMKDENLTQEQVKHHINYVKRKAVTSSPRGEKHRESIIRVISGSTSVDENPLVPDSPSAIEENDLTDLSPRSILVSDVDSNLLEHSTTNSSSIRSSSDFESWQAVQKSKQQQQRESNIAKKAREKLEMVEAVREQNKYNQQFQEQRIKLDEKLVDIVSGLADAWQEPKEDKLLERISNLEQQTASFARTQTCIETKLDLLIQHFQLNPQ